MTSKEALEQIIFDAKLEKPIFSMYYKEFLKPIEKDLEVLEILKSNVVSLNMITIFETCEGYNDWAKEYHRYSSLLTEEDFKKVKEWLSNE